MVEHSAVNRRVVGSNPTSGAKMFPIVSTHASHNAPFAALCRTRGRNVNFLVLTLISWSLPPRVPPEVPPVNGQRTSRTCATCRAGATAWDGNATDLGPTPRGPHVREKCGKSRVDALSRGCRAQVGQVTQSQAAVMGARCSTVARADSRFGASDSTEALIVEETGGLVFALASKP